MPTPTAFFQGQYVPLEDAKIGVMTHAFNYGTAVFEGVRGNWNDEEGQLYLFRVRDHIRRVLESSKIMRLGVQYSEDEIVTTVERVAEMSGFREDVYIRPLVYKSDEVVGLRMHNLAEDFLVFVTPFGAYLDPEAGVRCVTSSWRRVDDTMIPARAKVTGLYVNNAMAKTEAELNGVDEAIMLNQDGHVSEGSGENIVMMRHGRLVTPPPSDNILEGITLETALEIAKRELGLEVERRTIDRSELYIADEVFMTGTAAHVTPVTEIDRIPIGDGEFGEVSRLLQRRYFEAITGRIPEYADWLTPVYTGAAVEA
ncbi:MAG: branched-chain amino acid transaminase [Dehalococcoidia bacterium]|mgnify:CR=1 FL=1|jgi:branched-chain amino acid aminotransferase|nr:branched-chain amino acid transaminase [Dehalococcoidia bacterium]